MSTCLVFVLHSFSAIYHFSLLLHVLNDIDDDDRPSTVTSLISKKTKILISCLMFASSRS